MQPREPNFRQEVVSITSPEGIEYKPINAVTPDQAMERLERFMRMHGLANWSYGWITDFNRAAKYVGLTYVDLHRIELSSLHLSFMDSWGLADVIKHEIAHALAPIGAGHGSEWQRIAVSLGALPLIRAVYRKEYLNV